MAAHFRPLKIEKIQKETAECVSIRFEIPEIYRKEFEFIQGQNVTLRATIEGVELRRSYSICSSPDEDGLEIAIKKAVGGKFSSFANEELKDGDVIEVLAPTGTFFTPLRPGNDKHYVAFAAGSGITPIISIIKTTLQREVKSRFYLIYGNKTKQTIVFKEQLEALKDKYLERFSIVHVLSREATEAPINQGRIDADKCLALLKPFPRLLQADEYFICGPESMIHNIRNWLVKGKVNQEKIHFELFSVPGQSSSTESVTRFEVPLKDLEHHSQVTIIQDGETFSFDLPYLGSSILQAALDQGADLPFSCKGGVCATCRAKLVSGQVAMDANYALEPDEIQAGFILTCQSHPRSESVSIDFDQRG